MNWEIWTLYVFTVIGLMSTPGPSQLLMLSNSLSNGFKRSSMTACGDLTANMLQMLAAGFGLAALIVSWAGALNAIKWAGAAYLLWLGVRMIRSARSNASMAEGTKTASLHSLWLQGFFTSASNPKAVVFFAALFPQFIDPNQDFAVQFIILSATYIIMDGMFLTAYGLSAGWMAKRFKGTVRIWIERAGGGFMIAAAMLLALKTQAEG